MLTTPSLARDSHVRSPSSGTAGGEVECAPAPAMASAYSQYFKSGLYEKRYPQPNQRSLKTILAHTTGARAILDYGCGDGRYLFPLLGATQADLFALDVCPDALDAIKGRLMGLPEGHRVTPVLFPSMDMTAGQPIDLALMMFGVLGHIPRRADRIATLKQIRERLRPDGRLILSVPNARRRFFREQRHHRRMIEAGNPAEPALEPGDILYERRRGHERIQLFYHLFTEDELAVDLAEAGFSRTTITAESVLPESVVTRFALGRIADQLLHPLTPTALGYGLLAVATP